MSRAEYMAEVAYNKYMELSKAKTPTTWKKLVKSKKQVWIGTMESILGLDPNYLAKVCN